MKKITFWLFALFACVQVQAQVSLYSFAQSNETYSEITGGTVLGTATDPTSFDSTNWTIPATSIPFNFNFNGVDYTGCTVNSNGYITFGATLPATTTSAPISVTTAFAGAISAFGGDLCGAFIANLITSETRWEVVGTAPNREFVVQFKNWRPNYSSSITDVPYINFQIRLAETTNQIKIVYGSNGYAIGSLAAASTRQIGLRGASNTDYKNRTNTTTQLFTASTVGTVNTSSQAFNTSVATPGMPTNGLVYTYTPPVACTGTPVAGTVAPAVQNLCAGATPAALTLTGNSEGFTGLTFQWETSADNTTWANATGASATTMVYSPLAFAGPTTVYYRCKITCTGSVLFSYSNVVTVNSAGTPVGQATGLNFTNIGYFGLTANWTNSDGNRRVVYISNAPIVDPVDGPGAALVAAAAYAGTGQQVVYDGTGTSIAITGLQPNTQYYVKVVQYLRCGAAAPYDYYFNTTTGTNANTVTTAPPTALPWSEGFATTTWPAFWVNTGFSLGTVTAINPALASNYSYKNFTSASALNAVTPIFVPVPANHRFVFTYKASNNTSPYAPAAANSFNIVVAISTDNGTTYTDVATIPNNGSAGWQTYALDLAAYTGQSIRIKVTSNWVTGNFYVAYDNFKIEAIPTCEAPSWGSLTATNVAATTATVSWTAPATAPANGYDYYVSTTNTDPLSTTAPTASVAAGVVTTNLTALAGNTTYYVWVRSNCATSDVSTWSGPVSFTTLCTNVTAFTQNFDGVTAGSAAINMPACWVKIGTSGSCYTSTVTPVGSAPNVLYFYGTSATSAPTMRMQPVSNLGAGTHRLKFKMRSASTTTLPSVDFGYLTDPYDATTFVSLTSFATTGNTMVDYVYMPPAGTYSDYPAIKMMGSVYGTAYMDDFVWEPIPSCTDPSAIVFAQVAATTAVISWDAPATAPAVGYEYVVSTTNPPPTAAGTATTSTFASLSGLTPNATQYVFVRSICSTTEASPWAGPVAFTTLCANVTAFTQNFDGVTAGSAAINMPACWVKVGTTGSCYTSTNAPVGSAPNVIYFNGSSTNVPTMRMQPVSNLGAGTHRLKFKMRSSSTTILPNIDFGYLTDPYDAATFVSLANFATTGTTMVDYVYMPPAGTYSDYPAIKMMGSVYGTAYMDDFIWEAIPSCPDPSALVSANVTSSTVNISWDAPATAPALGYEYVVSTTNTPPTAAGTAVTTTFASVSGLTPNATQYVFVRSICSTTDASPWAGPITFTTLCANVTAFTQNFDGVTAGSAAINMPACWVKVGTSGSCYTSTTTPVGSTPNVIYFYGSSATNAPTMRMQPVSNLGAGTHRLKFKMRSSSATTLPSIDFGYLTNPYDATTFVSLTSFATTGNTMVNYVYMPPAGTYSDYPAIKMMGSVYGTAYIDDFVWEPIPTCLEPTALVTANGTASSIDISWNAITPSPTTGYEYFVSTSNTIPVTAGTATTSTFATLSGLLPNTTYYVFVRSDCSAGDFSSWSGPISFYTGYCVPSSSSASSYVNNFSTTGGSQNISNLSTGFTTGGYLNASSQFVEGYATSSFSFNAAIVGGTVGFAVWIDWNNDLVFNNATEKVYNTTSYGNGPFTGTISIPAGTALGNYRMRITTDWNASNPSNPCAAATRAEFEDYTVSVIAQPACVSPSSSASGITDTTATLSWAAVSSATLGYEYVLDNVATDPTGSGTSTSALTYSASSLTSSTVYYFHIRSVCSTGTYSTWSTISFTTLITPPANDNCANAIVLTPGAVFATNPLVATNVGATGSTETAPGCASYLGGDVWYSVIVPASGSITLETGTNTGTTIADTGLAVYSGTCGALVLVNCDDDSATGSFSLISLTGRTPGEELKIRAWEYGNNVFNTFQISAYDASLSSSSFDKSTFVAYPNPVKDVLNLSYKTAISNVRVVNLLGQEVLNTKTNTNDVQVNMSALTAGAYIVNITVEDTVHTIKVIKE